MDSRCVQRGRGGHIKRRRRRRRIAERRARRVRPAERRARWGWRGYRGEVRAAAAAAAARLGGHRRRRTVEIHAPRRNRRALWRGVVPVAEAVPLVCIVIEPRDRAARARYLQGASRETRAGRLVGIGRLAAVGQEGEEPDGHRGEVVPRRAAREHVMWLVRAR